MAKYHLRIEGRGKQFRLIAGQGNLFSEVLDRAGLNLRFYCQGRGICGQCFVEITEGDIPRESLRERELRQDKKLADNFRLACQLRVFGSLTIKIPDHLWLNLQDQVESEAESRFKGPSYDFNPLVKKYVIRLSGRAKEEASSLADELKTHLCLGKLKFSLSALEKIPSMAEIPGQKITVVVYEDREVIDAEPGDTTEDLYGLAVDLGTTTIAAQLVDLNSGKVVSQKATLNKQGVYGSDIISRIAFASTSSSNLEKLQEAALKSIKDAVSFLIEESGLKRNSIYALSLAGNTAMNHLMLGLPVSSLGRWPFRSVFSLLPPIKARDMRLEVNSQAVIYICPNLRSFIGGDVASGIIATGLSDEPGNVLYVDLGTNGEVILKKGRSILAASTAAGPAFEGVGVSCGLIAVPGAIESVSWEKGKFSWRTIGGREPEGICGTGLVGLMAEAMRAGLLSSSGKILAGESEIPLTPKTGLKQKDIRQLQLAMGAIKAGIRLLLSAGRLKLNELDKVYVAGAFGNGLDLKQCLELGLLPPLPPKKITFVGNASLAGARRILLSLKAKEKIETLAGKIQFLSLADKKEFELEFLRALKIGQDYWKKNA